MKYTAPDGHVMISSPNGPVSYQCANTNSSAEGTYESVETKSASNQFGIQQIHVTRVITEDTIDITIRESTDAELQAYLDSIIREQPQPVIVADPLVDPNVNPSLN